jgi:hypothetical protein
MKSRTALIYLAVFLLLAGYFYYFEVVRRKARIEQEEAASHLFQPERAKITAVQLDQAGTKPILLKKNGHWLIVEPISTRADESAVGSLLSSLLTLKIARQVEAAAEDLQPYGLDQPKLRLSFLADGTRHHLRIGGKAVVGDQLYASGDQESRVVLIDGSKLQSLEKTFFDLRSKEFFNLKSEDVNRIEIKRSNDYLVLAHLDEGRWQAVAAPELKIKGSKVESFLNRLIWLRAKRFFDGEEGDIARLGLNPAQIRVSLFTPEKTETLLFGKTKKDEGTYVNGDQLPGVAIVPADFVDELPDNLSDLEDRTFLVFGLDQVKAMDLELDAETARLEWHDERWNWAGDDDREDPESWLVNSLLRKLQELEYQPGAPPPEQSLPENKQLNLILLAKNGQKLGTFLVPEIPSEKQEKGVLLFSKGSETAQPYWISGESLRELHENTKKLSAPES